MLVKNFFGLCPKAFTLASFLTKNGISCSKHESQSFPWNLLPLTPGSFQPGFFVVLFCDNFSLASCVRTVQQTLRSNLLAEIKVSLLNMGVGTLQSTF